jgi:DNA-directed RNA polymerase subunit RPC12/RpoP
MKANCAKCQAEYDKKSELDSIFCPLCRMLSKVRTYEYISETFWAFGLFCSLWFIPLAIGPLILGADSSGYYRMLRKDVTPSTVLTVNLVNIGLTIAFLSVWIYFKRKLTKTKIRLSQIEKNNPNFGKRWKE